MSPRDSYPIKIQCDYRAVFRKERKKGLSAFGSAEVLDFDQKLSFLWLLLHRKGTSLGTSSNRL